MTPSSTDAVVSNLTAGEAALYCKAKAPQWVQVLPGWFWQYRGEADVSDIVKQLEAEHD
jgi:hypothetical protein